MITLEDLKTGKRAQASLNEYKTLRGCSKATIYRENNAGIGLPYRRDPKTGRIFYDAQTILRYFDSIPTYSSTVQYEHGRIERMELARSAKSCAKKSNKAIETRRKIS